jgi:hypothetical protein
MSDLPSTITNLYDYSDKVVRINDDGLYYHNIVLFNPDGDVVRLKQSGIKALVLEDKLDTFYHKGYLIYENRFDVLENIAPITPPQNKSNQFYNEANKNFFKGYRFRGDGRDFLYLDIMPDVQGKGSSVIQGNFDEDDKKIFNLRFVFSIYDSEDTLGESSDLKYKKLYFHDISYQIMNEKNVYFSTADLIQNEQIILLNNQDRSVQTGIAIKELIKKIFPEEENYKVKFSEFWDQGGSSIFYSSPAQSKAIDDLKYLMDFHVSTSESNYDMCFLRKERYTDEWKLMSYNDLFERAYEAASAVTNLGLGGLGGQEMSEVFFLAFPTDPSSKPDVTNRVPDVRNNLFTFNNSSVIDQYEFTNISGMDVQNDLVSHPVHSHNFETNTFRIDITNNNIDKAQEIYYNNYVEKMKGEQNNPASNLSLNKYRSQQKNIKNVFSVSSESQNQRFSFGRNQILKSALYLNNCIKFKIKGNTSRQAGKFISIQRNNPIPDNTFDDKNLGIYLILNCQHLFTDTSYDNEIIAVKTYNFKDIGLTKDYL